MAPAMEARILFFFFFFKIYLLFIYFWLHWVLVAARRLFVVVCGLLSSCGAQAPGCVGSVVCSMQALVEAHELSSCGTQA